MKKKVRVKICAAAAMALFLAAAVLCRMTGEWLWKGTAESRETSVQGKASNGNLVILDPGHGGYDGGKVGVNGVEEKEINLKISLAINELLQKEGITVQMTRSDDDRLGETQTEDLKQRVKQMNESEASLVVSIHQNSYHEENVSGAQVFYYTDSSEGKRAAEILQECLREIDPENTKQAKANNTYYILKKTSVPVVIVECGFLSNYEEAEKLADEAYQNQAAEAVTKGILQYLNE